jgi:hypothetical protein
MELSSDEDDEFDIPESIEPDVPAEPNPPALAPYEPVEKKPESEVGVSWDSYKMRSTLHNIDLEEVTRCLGHAVAKHIKFSVDLRSRNDLSLTIMPEFFDEDERQ